MKTATSVLVTGSWLGTGTLKWRLKYHPVWDRCATALHQNKLAKIGFTYQIHITCNICRICNKSIRSFNVSFLILHNEYSEFLKHWINSWFSVHLHENLLINSEKNICSFLFNNQNHYYFCILDIQMMAIQ